MDADRLLSSNRWSLDLPDDGTRRCIV